MTNGREINKQAVYQIRVKGNLDKKWSDWFNGMAIAPQTNDETLLVGPVADQAHLRSVLERLFDLNLTLLSVTRVEMDSKGENSYETGH